MKKIFSVFFLIPFCSNAQNDSVQALFKNATYSYLQMDLGYTGMAMKDDFLNGFSWDILGVVFNDKIAASVGFDMGFGKNYSQTNTVIVPYKIDVGGMFHFKTEYLVKPKRLVNFSFPVKFGYASAGYYDSIPAVYTTSAFYEGKQYYYNYDWFYTVAPGATLFINLFKCLSLGAGADYRFAFGVKNIGTNSNYSSYSVSAFLRIKLDTKAYMKKALEQQRLYLKQMQAN